MSFHDSLFFGGGKGGIAWSSSCNRQEWDSRICTSCTHGRSRREEYLLASPHREVGLHKQFLSLFYLCWNTLITKLGEKKSLFFTFSRVSGNITLVTDPFLVWGLASLMLYLWHIPSVCHVNSSTQECPEFGICYLCVLTLENTERYVWWWLLTVRVTLRPDLVRMKPVQGWWAPLAPDVTSEVVRALGTSRVFGAVDGDQPLR